MARDLLVLLEYGFTDPAHPGERFICPDGAPIEGLLAGEPERAARLDIRRLPFARPRAEVVALLGEQHQGLPVLILGDEHPLPEEVQSANGRHFVTDPRRILALLAQRHGFARVH